MCQSDGLPAMICSTCVYKCVTWFSFKQQCEHIDSILRNQLNLKSFLKTDSANTIAATGQIGVVETCRVLNEPPLNDISEINDVQLEDNFSEETEEVQYKEASLIDNEEVNYFILFVQLIKTLTIHLSIGRARIER